MTPREKAFEIYDKFLDEMIESDSYFVEAGAFRCALQAVELALEFVGGELDVAFDKTVFLVAVKHELIDMKNEWSKPKLK